MTDQRTLQWSLIEAQVPTSARLTVRLAFPSRRSDIMIAIDSSSSRHALVEIPVGEPSSISERTSRGLSLQTVEMRLDTGGTQNFVDLICHDRQGYPALDTIILEIAQALDSGASINRIALVQNVLAKWQRFWSGLPQSVLTKEQQLGLFGELWFLHHWLGASMGTAFACGSWRGPLGSRNDFEIPMVGIEIKTSGRLDPVHQIHGLEQLMAPNDGQLFLMSIVVRDEASAAESLPKLIKEIRGNIGHDYGALTHFETCLYSIGYNDLHESEYLKLKLRVRQTKLYKVTLGFPRLTPASLVTELPLGVSAVQYELRLDAAEPWCVASAPLQAKDLLQSIFAKG